ncbi:unnamed protein product [Adineta steineri]|uniref:non-specific protein-tyrosine kinase n=1 Tax=Adineta steineri TaxID=433720 RepID=A0A818IY27_9BILA|nr:unnamed protein product [Adineta steineri]CAF1273737.1 unnamed protein product [Adineta steineri]CAF3530551.1 unnamed protein product [Adineta steineri]CAF3636934.1 unnamed protein product [Adineta steineri]
MVNDYFDLLNENSKKRNSVIELSNKFPNDIQCPSSINNLNNKKTNCVQLYKPIYIARHSKIVNDKFSYDEGDEFELINKLNEDYFHVIHLRTNTQCTLHRAYIYLDLETPLRLGSDDRGVIQRCLLQYNIPGAYLIRRSKNESNAFVLSIAQISNQRNAEDWHYLICINPKTRCFYFAQESKLDRILFTSFRKLIHHEKVLDVIPLTKRIPFQIEFEEDLWHIPIRCLTLEYRIGIGEFGEVWRALWQNGKRKIPVAVKKLHRLNENQSTINNYMREIEILKTLRNNYIVTLYGVAQDFQTNEILLITELMENGDLKNWLELCQDVPSEKTIISYAYDICRGMTYLEQQSHVHRDLACRNLLLGIGKRTVKIADFGLSTFINKNDYTQHRETYSQRLPIRWTAPEVLHDQKFYSIKSDVWSFGIVLIEIWLKGDDPYPEEKEFSAIRSLVQNGYIHKKPLKCSDRFYNRLILPCLSYKPNQRPNFQSLVEILHQWNKEKIEHERSNYSNVEFLS